MSPPYPPYAAGHRPVLRAPSGLFASGPPRPIYRERLPVRPGAIAVGVAGGALWMLLFGLVATNARGYAWMTIAAGAAAWLVALLLTRLGDRGVAVGLGMSAGLGVAVAVGLVFVRWASGHWLLW